MSALFYLECFTTILFDICFTVLFYFYWLFFVPFETTAAPLLSDLSNFKLNLLIFNKLKLQI